MDTQLTRGNLNGTERRRRRVGRSAAPRALRQRRRFGLSITKSIAHQMGAANHDLGVASPARIEIYFLT